MPPPVKETVQPRKPEPQAVQVPPQSAPAPEQNPSTKPSARGMLEHLKATGTPDRRLEEVEALLRHSPQATAEEAYRLLEAAKVQLGTLRKAGKFAFGELFDPEWAGKQAPVEELERLASENATLRSQLEAANSRALSLQKQGDHLRDRVNELTRQVAILKPRLSPEERAAAGIDN